MDNLNKILGGLLIAALIYIIFLKGCGDKHSCPDPVTVIRIDSVTVVDTVKFKVKEFEHIDRAFVKIIRIKAINFINLTILISLLLI
ncbi:MAG: hypothetical protein IH964_02930 [Candidatus Dadabacteria bacterium]|nr:hypothetical protein [Candidatus Dadabacteria bacterium]